MTEFPQLCESETEAFGRLLGTPVQRQRALQKALVLVSDKHPAWTRHDPGHGGPSA